MLGLGLSQYAPYAIYGLAFLIALASLFYRSEIGILFIAPLLPLYSVLREAIRSGLPLAADMIDIIVIAMVLGSLFKTAKNGNSPTTRPTLLFPIFVLVGYTLASLIIGSSTLGVEINLSSGERLAHWKNYMIMPVLYILTYYNLRDRKWQNLLFILLFFSFLLIDYKFHHSFSWVKHVNYVEKSRIPGTLGNLGPNEWGSFHTIYTLFIIGLFLVDKHFWRRTAYLLLIIGNMYSLIYSFSRGSYVGLLIGLIFIGFVRSRKLLLILILFLSFWKSFVPLSVQQRVEGTFIEEGSRSDAVQVGGENLATAGRKQIWTAAFDQFKRNPLLGNGYNTFNRLIGVDPHNAYLEVMAEQGMIGLSIYLWFYFLALRSAWRLYQHADEELLKAFGFAFLCAVVGSMVVNLFGDRWTYLQVGGIFWIIWALVDQQNNKLSETARTMSQQDPTIHSDTELVCD